MTYATWGFEINSFGLSQQSLETLIECLFSHTEPRLHGVCKEVSHALSSTAIISWRDASLGSHSLNPWHM